jgi:hypothetical protein
MKNPLTYLLPSTKHDVVVAVEQKTMDHAKANAEVLIATSKEIANQFSDTARSLGQDSRQIATQLSETVQTISKDSQRTAEYMANTASTMTAQMADTFRQTTEELVGASDRTNETVRVSTAIVAKVGEEGRLKHVCCYLIFSTSLLIRPDVHLHAILVDLLGGTLSLTLYDTAVHQFGLASGELNQTVRESEYLRRLINDQLLPMNLAYQHPIKWLESFEKQPRKL